MTGSRISAISPSGGSRAGLSTVRVFVPNFQRFFTRLSGLSPSALVAAGAGLSHLQFRGLDLGLFATARKVEAARQRPRQSTQRQRNSFYEFCGQTQARRSPSSEQSGEAIAVHAHWSSFAISNRRLRRAGSHCGIDPLHVVFADRNAMGIIGSAPTSPFSISNCAMPCLVRKAAIFSTSAMTSRPMPSPGKQRVYKLLFLLLLFGRALSRADGGRRAASGPSCVHRGGGALRGHRQPVPIGRK